MITLDQVTKKFSDSERPAVNQVSLQVRQGHIFVFVGPSGCGKTTILRLINRLEEPTRGRVLVDGQDTQKMDPNLLRRNMGYVIQQVGLLPHKTIEQNVSLVPELLGWTREEIQLRVKDLLTLVGLDPGEVIHKYPHQLSGGQVQRVGVARAMAADPPVMLMDEPFGAVDPIVRIRLQDEFLRLQQKFQKTICFVTHDINEAIKMGDSLVIMDQGSIVQTGTPIEILTHPANDFVVHLVGEDRGVKILDLTRSENLMIPLGDSPEETPPEICRVQAIQPVKVALETMLKYNSDQVGVYKGDSLMGTLNWDQIKEHISLISDSDS